MPYIVPNLQGTFTATARGTTVYDNKGNYNGAFSTGFVPPCVGIPTVSTNPNYPVGALNGAYRPSVPTCKTGFHCTAKSYAPWSSCKNLNGPLF
jgi:hypothetical protein